MGKRRWTPRLEDEYRRTVFRGQTDIFGTTAAHEFQLPPEPTPPAEPPRPEYVYAPGEQPALFE